MFKSNPYFKSLTENYLFSSIAGKVNRFVESNPNASIIRLGIGDVTLPLCKAATDALVKASSQQGTAQGFAGYGPEQGYEFLREKILINDYLNRDISLDIDEIFISDGAKSDLGNITDIISNACTIGITDPVYPVYLDSNLMVGRKIILLPCDITNDFKPTIPDDGEIDVIYLCSPNNPTGTALTRSEIAQWVEYALRNKSLILFDSAYEAYISDADIPHSIYEVEGAKKCAIEFRSFSKTAGFTGLRCGYTIVPKALIDADGNSLNNMWRRRQCTKFNGASYIVQRAAEALYTPDGRTQVAAGISYYMNNAETIKLGIEASGLRTFGGVNSPYIWAQVPEGMNSWEFFDYLLEKCNIVCTPGIGFGRCGEGFVRFTAFNTTENTIKAVSRIKENLTI